MHDAYRRNDFPELTANAKLLLVRIAAIDVSEDPADSKVDLTSGQAPTGRTHHPLFDQLRLCMTVENELRRRIELACESYFAFRGSRDVDGFVHVRFLSSARTASRRSYARSHCLR